MYLLHELPSGARAFHMPLGTASCYCRHVSASEEHTDTRVRYLAPETGPMPSYNKLCLLEDFEHPRIRHTIRKVFHHDLARFGPSFPRGKEYRKYWESQWHS